ncbi:major facilitator superfamily domain-containing protein [Phycomyces nitens]|nr:major facilitator superfamily domain-containing protein [Phycomyces nitens]
MAETKEEYYLADIEKDSGVYKQTYTETTEVISESVETSSHAVLESGASGSFDEQGNKTHIVSPAERSLVRKLDFIYVMPCITVLNFLQFFDKSALNYSAVLGIAADTGLHGQQFSWLGSIFYLGYLVYQPINAYFLQRVPLAKYLGTLISLWGAVLALTSLGKNFSQLAALRFLLGFFEAGVYPCCIMLISIMYRRTEQAGRIGALYICNGIAMAIGGLISYGIGHMVNVGGKAPWQWIMIILGCATTLFGVIFFVCLIDNPTSRFLRLTPEQEDAVKARTLDNAVVYSKEIKKSHILESLGEARFWLFCFASLLINLQNGALTTFNSIITVSFGFSSLNAILLSIPSGVIDCIYIVAAVYINKRWGHTLLTCAALLGFSTLGLILLISIPSGPPKLAGLYLCWAYAAAYVMLLTSVANNVAGYTKKVFYSTGIMIFYTIGNFAGPQMMLARQAPRYLGGMLGYMAANVICMVLLVIARHLMIKSNRERLANPSNAVIDINDDLTDRENPHYIYRV